MKLLAFDTSTEACSVALWVDGEICEYAEQVGQRHSLRLLPMLEEALANAGLRLSQMDALAFGQGPGSFTSLRIGAGIAQGLAFGAALPVVPVSSLAALAQGQAAHRVLAAFDARMAQVYAAAYVRAASGLMELQGREEVCAPAQISLPDGDGWIGVGSGWNQYRDELFAAAAGRVAEWVPDQYPGAGDVAVLAVERLRAGHGVSPTHAVPEYLRNRVADKPASTPGSRSPS